MPTLTINLSYSINDTLAINCLSPNNENHECFCLSNNLDNSQNNIFLSAKHITDWVLTGKITHKTDPLPLLPGTCLASFNPCSTLPIIQLKIGNNKITAICDTGASRSVLSSALATNFWGKDYKNHLDLSSKFFLKDVNNRPLRVEVVICVDFHIGEYFFHMSL